MMTLNRLSTYLPFLLAGALTIGASGSLRTVPAKNPTSQPGLQLETVASVSGTVIPATIDNFAFGPKELTVKVGSTVQWTNQDDMPHTVTSSDGLFASPVMDTDQTFLYTFKKPGRFTYYCKLHPSMTGVVVVEQQKP